MEKAHGINYRTRRILMTTSIFVSLVAGRVGSTHTFLGKQIVGLIKEMFLVSSAPTSAEAMNAGTDRWGLWMKAMENIESSPIIGTGNTLLRPHNEYLQFAVVWGLPSLIIYLTAFVVILIKTIKRFKKLSNLTLILGFCVLGYLISAIFGNTMPHTVPFFALFLGFFIRQLNEKADVSVT